MAFQENNPGFWIPEKEDDSIQGILINIQKDVGTNKSMLYTIEQDKKPTNVWGSTILDQRMVGIKVGDLIKITYKGLAEKKAGKNPPKIFKVEVDR
jgi:hypothetical protein